jgi:Cu-Zn family superoxide dismutase
MKITTILTITVTLGIFYLLSSFEQKRIMENTRKAEAVLIAKSGSKVSGKVSFSERDGVVTMKAMVRGASPGDHAIHIHVEGDCSAEDGSSAGGHWNPTGEDHGEWNSDSFHRGDIGNIEVGKDGEGRISRTTELWCIGCEDPKKDILGKAIIIHAGIDDFSTQPSGAAGARIGCGVIEGK